MPWKWDWTNAFHVVEAYKSTLTGRIVIYNKPNWGSWNHNTDGSFTGVKARQEDEEYSEINMDT
ncbi:hypothetical protein H5410_013183 [Solanum commersonii]|uniref:Uncharacterized protein n=1 Tax=Solanum commersonii TaxID=4109 RepID=A0A9J6ATR3_SOLCO|nr:hypothetical protein H5410_013183 [Solanum commersonii]